MVYLDLPADLGYRHLALRAVLAVCQRLAQPAGFGDAVVSAVGEAFNNAVIHGGEPGAAGEAPRVEIAIGASRQAVEIQVADYGPGFSLSDVALPELDPLSIDELPERGMGLFIIHGLMTEVRYAPGRPNVLFMRKRLG